MTRQDNIKQLISNHQRRLQKLKEKQALYGMETPVHILIEVEDVEVVIEQLQAELAALSEPRLPQPRASTSQEAMSTAVPQPSLPRRTLFVGRQRHLQTLDKQWTQTLQHNQGRVVFLTGEAGIGKTSLIHQFSRRVLEQCPTTRYAYAQCDQIAGDVSPYAPFIHILNSLTEQAARRGQNWTVEYLRQVGPDILQMIPVAGPLLAAAVKSVDFAWQRRRGQHESGSDQFGQQDIFQQFVDSLRNIAQHKNPLLLCIDDWHWADTSSTNLLFHLARQLADAPILLLTTYRPHDAEAREHPILTIQAEMERYQICDHLSLEFLSQEEVTAYLSQRFPAANFGVDFIDWLLKTTSGNALFITEYISLLLNEKRLTPTGDLTGSLDDLQPPGNVEAVIRSRIGYLDRDAREMLAYGSIEGEQFTTLLLSRLLEMRPLSLIRKLRAIEETHHLISSLGQQSVYEQQTTVYRFVHALIHRTLYSMLEAEECHEISRLLFALLTEIYEQADESTKSRLLPELMTHAAGAGAYLAEAQYALAAAEASAKNHAHNEVRKLCDQGLAALDKMTRITIEPSHKIKAIRINLLARKGQAEYFLGYHQTALDIQDQIKLLADDDQTILDVLINMAKSLRHLGDYSQTQLLFEKAVVLAEQLGHRDRLAEAYQGLVAVFIDHDYDEALKWNNKAIRLWTELGNKRRVASSYNSLGLIYIKQKKYQQALELYEKIIVTHKELDSKVGLGWDYNNIGLVYVKLEDCEQALNYYKQALSIFEDLNFKRGMAAAMAGIATAYRKLTRYEEAKSWFAQSTAINEESKNQRGLGWNFKGLGDVYADQGKHHKALVLYQKSLKIWDNLGVKQEIDDTRQRIVELKAEMSE